MNSWCGSKNGCKDLYQYKAISNREEFLAQLLLPPAAAGPPRSLCLLRIGGWSRFGIWIVPRLRMWRNRNSTWTSVATSHLQGRTDQYLRLNFTLSKLQSGSWFLGRCHHADTSAAFQWNLRELVKLPNLGSHTLCLQRDSAPSSN